MSELSSILLNIQNIRNSLQEACDSILQDFEKFLCRPDEKQSLIDPFLKRLSGLLESRAIITSRSRKAMNDELDNLSDSLWDIIERRKDENLLFYENLKEKDPTLSLVFSVTESAILLIKSEVQRFVRSFNLILQFHFQILKDCEENFLEFPNFENEESFGKEKILFFVEKAEEFAKSIEDSLWKEEGLDQFLKRLKQIETWAFKTLEMVENSSKSAFVLMDAWIGDAVMAENKFVNEIIDM